MSAKDIKDANANESDKSKDVEHEMTDETTDETTKDEAPEVAFSFTFDDDDESADLAGLADAARSDDDAAEEDEDGTTDGSGDTDAADASDGTNDTDADTSEEDADGETEGGETAVPDETSKAATEANARRVNETIALAGDAMASGDHGDPNELRHAQAHPDAEVDEQVADRVLLKSYPNFSLNHATTTNRKSGRHVLDDVSMGFYAGELYAVRVLPDEQDAEERVTMMEVFGGFQVPTSGSAMTKSSNLVELEINELRGHRLGLVPQRFAVRGDLDAESNVLYAMNASGRTYLKPKPIAAREFLAKVGFGEATSGRKVKDLPLVEQRRVAIARAISCESDTLILDEPTKGLEASDAKEILDLLVSIAHGRDPKRAVIIVTSRPEVVDRADKVYSLDD